MDFSCVGLQHGSAAEIALPEEERRLTFTPEERNQFRETMIANEHVRIFLAKDNYREHALRVFVVNVPRPPCWRSAKAFALHRPPLS